MTRNARLGVTIRFNGVEREALREMCFRYQKEPKDVLKLAFALLVDSDRMMREKEKQENEKNNNSDSTDSVESSSMVNPDEVAEA